MDSTKCPTADATSVNGQLFLYFLLPDYNNCILMDYALVFVVIFPFFKPIQRKKKKQSFPLQKKTNTVNAYESRYLFKNSDNLPTVAELYVVNPSVVLRLPVIFVNLNPSPTSVIILMRLVISTFSL